MMIATATTLLLLLSAPPPPIMAFTATSVPSRTSTLRTNINNGAAAAALRRNNDHPSIIKSSSLNAIREATFGMGCFWEPAESLLKEPGVLTTTVGYTGAPPSKPPPTYDTVCFGNDYVEAVRVVYDDTIINYTTLLDKFFEFQKPGLSRQYASIIFANDNTEEQNEATKWKVTAMKTKGKRTGDNLPYEIVQIEPLSSFYRAEEYHQSYWKKQRGRAVLAVLLLAGSYGAYDDIGGDVIGRLEVMSGYDFDTICNAVFLIGAAWMILERLVVRDVRELKSGDLISEVKLS